MEKSLNSDLWNNVTTSLSEDDVQTLYLATIRHLSLKIIYLIIGTVGVLDNLFVVMVFALFIHIADKVAALLQHFIINIICVNSVYAHQVMVIVCL